ncbi:MAG: aspartyl/asparaginyl beta-hydroxylase domain-containing protein [Hyphomonadaceae bacterium]|nr:aspartyl/asparaginyl beta-hydroxylase domain-containing protein [Hyphomonadaceae bacterium]
MAEVRKLIDDAARLLQARDAASARKLLDQAAALEPANVQVRMQQALACRMVGDHDAALVAIDAALASDPYDFLALLSKATIFDTKGELKAAAQIYRNALKIAPSNPPPALKAPIERARRVVAEDAEAIHAFFRDAVKDLRAKHAGADLARFEESLDIFAGKAKPHVPEPAYFLFPRLAPLPFFPREHFPWLAQLEGATDIIRGECEAVMREDWAKFHPYIQFPAGAPVNQWAQLNHSEAWSTFHLWRDGAQQAENCARCPQTTEILASLPMADQPGFAPTAMFSVLQPKTRIPPHTGSSNTRVIVHLPLILPPDCHYRVGNDHRDWKMGEAWVFDDTIEHEAVNDSDEVRVLLIFDVWNPFLTPAERELVGALMNARNAYLKA